MTQGPENIRQAGFSRKKDTGFEPQQEVPRVEVETNPSILPLVDYRLMSIPAEAERRAALLSRVTVNDKGVARCADDRSTTETLLAAVRIDDNKDATMVPVLKDKDQLRLYLPSDLPSRIGFFVGYSSLQEVSAVLRMGLYPGVPLTTQTVSDEKTAEVMYDIGGIKPNEADELKWAEQIGLYSSLGFDPIKSRGMFNRSHRPNPESDIWKESPLIILPDELLDMVRHYDPNDVKKDEFQVQFYGIKPASPVNFGLAGPPRGGGGMGTRGLGIGFGDPVSRTAQTRGTNIDFLRGAFQIIVTPQ